MKIAKILNNNVVVINENNTEKIVMGRGIAFKKKVGDEIEKENIDKTFLLENSDNNNKLQLLLKDIPIEYFNITEEIVNFAKNKIERKLNDFLYITLMDHIYMSIRRFNDNINIKNMMLWDIKKFYKDEYIVGIEALSIIERNLNIKLTEDEAGFIALHIVNAQTIDNNNYIKEIEQVTKLIQKIIFIVEDFFSIKFDEESIYYNRFITHLKFFSLRLLQNAMYNGKENSNDDDLLTVVKEKYKESYLCSLKISEYILLTQNYDVSNEEKLYLTIHIEKARTKQ